MLIAEVANPNGLKLTKSDTDGIFLHFDVGEKQVGIRLDNPDLVGSSVAIIWAEQQFDRKDSQPDLLDACKRVQQYKEAAEKGQLKGDENAHEYWESVMSYVDAAIAKAQPKIGAKTE